MLIINYFRSTNMVLYSISDYYFENFYYIINMDKEKKLQYDCCTNNLSKLKGIKSFQKMNKGPKKFLMASYCNLPISEHELFNLRILVRENMEIEEYTVQYRNNQPPPLVILGRIFCFTIFSK